MVSKKNNIDRHHNIIKIIFDGNKHLKHVLSDKEIVQMTLIEDRFPLTKLPVCGHCEKLGLWSKDILTKKLIGVCRSCGSITKNPVAYSTYLASKMDVDPSGDTFRKMTKTEKKLNDFNRMKYLHEFRVGGTL